MFHLRILNGIINSNHLRLYAESVEPYGPELGVVDIMTRANIQLQGVELEDSPAILHDLHARNQISFQSVLYNNMRKLARLDLIFY